MSARKRHTAALDYMRQFLLWERARGPYIWSSDMVEKLVKRGWLRWRRPFHSSYEPRRNYLSSTAIGRRAVYVADRYTAPAIRRHHWDAYASWSTRAIEAHEARLNRRIADASTRSRDLHGTRMQR